VRSNAVAGLMRRKEKLIGKQGKMRRTRAMLSSRRSYPVSGRFYSMSGITRCDGA